MLAQATAIQRPRVHHGGGAPPAGPLAYLPSVISYQTLAPAMYAPLLPPASADADNPLGSSSRRRSRPGSAPRPSNWPVRPPSRRATSSVGSPAAMDRSFWYLVFAGYLDASSAYGASESIVESALTITEHAGTTCAYATFSGGDLIQTDTCVRRWNRGWAHAPAEMGAVLRRRRRQPADPVVRSRCAGRRPRPVSVSSAELIGWRSAELATISGVIAAGGGDTEIAAALERLAASASALNSPAVRWTSRRPTRRPPPRRRWSRS